MLAALFVIVAGLSAWAGLGSGNWGYLLAALGFLAIAPSAYYSPVALRRSSDATARATRRAPRWASQLALLGGLLVLVGVILRWLLD
jgi:hypothetical protein